MSNSSKDLKSLFRQQLGSKFPQANLNTKTKQFSIVDNLKSKDTIKRKFNEDFAFKEPKKTKSILKNKDNIPVKRNEINSIENVDKKVKFDNAKNTIEEHEPVEVSEDSLPETTKLNDVSSISDGFFDDPHLEMKTKKTVPKTKIDEDYELFLKSIDAVSKENEDKLELENQNDLVKLQIVENINETLIWSSFNDLIGSVEQRKKNCLTSPKIEEDSISSNSSEGEASTEDITWRKKSNL